MVKQLMSFKEMQLSCRVMPKKNEGRYSNATMIHINMGKQLVAYRQIPGKASTDWGMKEFLRNPSLFQKGPGFDTAKAANLF
jgi:hypothetical protein